MPGVCSTPGCPSLAVGLGRCATHGGRALRARRGTTSERDYGYRHRKLRKRIAAFVASGRAVCTICKQRIDPDSKWDLHHTEDRSGYEGPAHAGCNRGGVAPLAA